ncbi:unnamed protein product [Pelagomonas calceolata]|uniref:Uncharacterized protein n=1 Tax=Pelagomonas calceolata TaxID=35677 RepID=A0A8J2SHL7_9STRA|nr:unnamed protein product [Pelagomonas calceolata]
MPNLRASVLQAARGMHINLQRLTLADVVRLGVLPEARVGRQRDAEAAGAGARVGRPERRQRAPRHRAEDQLLADLREHRRVVERHEHLRGVGRRRRRDLDERQRLALPDVRRAVDEQHAAGAAGAHDLLRVEGRLEEPRGAPAPHARETRDVLRARVHGDDVEALELVAPVRRRGALPQYQAVGLGRDRLERVGGASHGHAQVKIKIQRRQPGERRRGAAAERREGGPPHRC